MDTAAWFRWFAEFEAAGSSPSYERICHAVAADDRLLARLDGLPAPKRQPNLLLAAGRFLDAPLDADEFCAFVLDRWTDVEDLLRARATQTNEAARTGAFLPILAALDGPLALIEVGASAGLCLYPDRYAVTYDGGPPLVESAVHVPVRTSGTVEVPRRVPDVVSRTGIDVHPLDPGDPDDLAWLAACIWPEHEHRRERLLAAAAVAAADPPRMIRGDLLDEVDAAIADAPRGSTPVVFHSAVLGYVDEAARQRFAARLAGHPGTVWLSNEGPPIVPATFGHLIAPPHAGGRLHFVLVRDGTTALALTDPHGSWIAGPPTIDGNA